MPVEQEAALREILGLQTVAVVGCSATPSKAAHTVPKYLHERGYDVVPVNPNAESIFGTAAYDSLANVEEEIDILNVFRPSDEVPGIVDEAVARDDVKVVWLQQYIEHDAAVERAEDAGLNAVQNNCIRRTHERLVAGPSNG